VTGFRFAGFRFLAATLALIFSATSAEPQDVQYSPQGEQIPGPSCAGIPQWYGGKPRTCQQGELSFWLSDVRHWRDERRLRIGFEPSIYDAPALKWTQSSFIQPQMMVHDRFFYDPVAQRYTVDKYLADVEARYGGIDSVLIWHTYPNIGIDSRNQFDMLSDLPGGIPAVKAMVADFHRHGVKVLFPVMVWDQGTRPDPNLWAELSRELAEIGADGVNGDTLDGIPQVLSTDSLKSDHPLALEPETGLAADEMINYNTMTWGYWNYAFTPSVSRYKWLEPRHMVNLSNRWAHDHLDDLQAAFFNGIGFESWENVWGIWNGMTPRDAEALRRISAIERTFAAQLISPAWEPHTPTRNYGVFASKWPTVKETLWTLVNRNAYQVDGGQLRLPTTNGMHYYDLWHGVELQPRIDDNFLILEFPLEAHGYGAVLETTQAPAELSPEIQKLLGQMKLLSQQPLQTLSNRWESMPQKLVPISATEPAVKQPEGMIRIPAADYTFRVNGIEIEGMNDEGVDVQYPWEESARRYHEHVLHIDSFWIDKFPVTNLEFKKFLDATQYVPGDAHNFLKDWTNGSYPENWDNKPVTWVSIEDARAYAKWVGKRLPHEWEWQYAAQGKDHRRYPWGNFEGPATPAAPGQIQAQAVSQPAAAPASPESSPTPAPEKGQPQPKKRTSPQREPKPNAKPNSAPNPPSTDKPSSSEACPTCPPVLMGSTPDPDQGREAMPPSNVDWHPKGASPFGVMDMTGNVWQWTDEYADEHTRYAILRGGSHYQPQGSRWYFPQAYELSQHGKYLLMAPSIDRSATVGFRCVKDATP
jgi:iron(II)-dependent oxidoreductase